MAHAGLATPPRYHQVVVYDVDRDLVDAIARYVAAGLADGEPAIVIATGAHLEAVDAALTLHGVDPSIARSTGSYLALDASVTLDSVMGDGLPDADKFRDVVGKALDTVRAGDGAVRAFGEMVALLWQQDNVSGAIALETLWNELAEVQQFSLLCGYPFSALATADLGDVNEMCRLHSAVIPLSSCSSPSPEDVAGAPAHSGVFVAVPEAVAAARRFIGEMLALWGEHDLVSDGELIVSELATNAIIHGGSPFRTSIERAPHCVRISVEDAGPGLPHSRSASEDAVNGRGVAIVDLLARRWGCDQLVDGKVFWAELETASAPPG